MKTRRLARAQPRGNKLREALALTCLAMSASAHGQSSSQLESGSILLAQAGEAARRYDIAAQPLDTALRRFQTIAGTRLRYDPAATRGLRTNGVTGNYSNEDALRQLLAGTGLTYSHGGSGTMTIERLVTGTTSGADGIKLGTIDVEGAQSYTGEFEVDEGFKAGYQSSSTRTPLPLRETPQSVSVVTQDVLQARQATDLGEALETAAGVNLYSGNGPFAGRSIFGLGAIQIRGVDTDFLTDIRQDGYPSPIFGAQPDLAPYERIDVVKGPSSLYGRGSAGGFVNRVTKKPLPELLSSVELSAGSFDFYRADGDVTGPLFASDKVRGRLVLAYEDAGSFVDFAESERVVVAPSVEFDLADSTRLLLQGNFQDDSFFPSNGFPLQRDGENFVAPDIRRSLFVGVPNRFESSAEILSASAQLEQQLGDNWLATVRLNHSQTRHRSQTDNYAFGIAPDGDIGLYSSAFRIDNDVWAGELRLEGSVDILGRPGTVVLGVDRTDVQNINDQEFGELATLDSGAANIYDENFADFPTVDPTPSFNGLFEQPSTGGYAQLQLRPADRLSVLVGGRYDSAETTNTDRVGGTRDERQDDALTGRVGLVFDTTDSTSLYALYAQSFRPILFETDANGNLLEPEEGEIFEGGVKTEWLDGRLGVNAAIFRLERDNVPALDPNNDPGEFFNINAGLQRSDGVELEINGEPLPGWRLSFAGTLLDSEFIEGTPETIGNSGTGVADWQSGLYTSYELQSGALRGLGVGLDLFALGERAVVPEEPGTLGGYERLDLQAFYNGFDPFEIQLLLRNVLDEKYVEGFDREGGFAQFGSPTAALLTVRYAFGQSDER